MYFCSEFYFHNVNFDVVGGVVATYRIEGNEKHAKL